MAVDELAAALQKLGFTNVSATEVFEVVKEEQARKHKAHVERGKALLRLASQPGKMQIREIPPYTSVVVKNPVPPTVQVRERRRRLPPFQMARSRIPT